MWSQKLKSGNVCYYERYKDPLTGKTKTVTITIKPTRKKADERAAREILREKIQKASAPQTEEITLGDLIERYYAHQLKTVKEQTAVSSKRHLSTVERLIGADAIVSRFTAPIISEKLWSDTPSTYNGRLKAFKALIRWAYQADYVKDIAYIDKLTKMKEPPARVKDAKKYLERKEIAKLLDDMKVERWKLLTEFLILSGLRIGEAIALEDRDVDVADREIRVDKTFSMITRKITSAKTETSEREIYMQDELLACCRKIRVFIAEEKMRFAYRSKYFIPDSTGARMHYDAYRKYLRENCEKAIGRPLTPHALRHTHVALLADSGVNLDAIMRRVGHADSHVTKQVYMHVTDQMRDKDKAAIKSLKMLDIC